MKKDISLVENICKEIVNNIALDCYYNLSEKSYDDRRNMLSYKKIILVVDYSFNQISPVWKWIIFLTYEDNET